LQEEEDEDEASLTEDQPPPIGHEESSANRESSTSANPESTEGSRRNLKDADVQVMIDQVMEKARETTNTEDEIQLLKLKLEEVTLKQVLEILKYDSRLFEHLVF
jgi:hypothetical protein